MLTSENHKRRQMIDFEGVDTWKYLHDQNIKLNIASLKSFLFKYGIEVQIGSLLSEKKRKLFTEEQLNEQRLLIPFEYLQSNEDFMIDALPPYGLDKNVIQNYRIIFTIDYSTKQSSTVQYKQAVLATAVCEMKQLVHSNDTIYRFYVRLRLDHLKNIFNDVNICWKDLTSYTTTQNLFLRLKVSLYDGNTPITCAYTEPFNLRSRKLVKKAVRKYLAKQILVDNAKLISGSEIEVTLRGEMPAHYNWEKSLTMQYEKYDITIHSMTASQGALKVRIKVKR